MTALENVLVGIHSNLRASPLGAMLNMPLTRQEEEAALVRAYELLEFVDLAPYADTLAITGVRQPAPPGDRPRAGERSAPVAARRADSRYEPAGDG